MTNSKNTHLWDSDILVSAETYNSWFLTNAPKIFGEARGISLNDVKLAFYHTSNLSSITLGILRQYPGVVRVLRVCLVEPLTAFDRVVTLSGVPKTFLSCMEKDRFPISMTDREIQHELIKLTGFFCDNLDRDIFWWLYCGETPSETDIHIARKIIAERLVKSLGHAAIRNAQEARQFQIITDWLRQKEYHQVSTGDIYGMNSRTFMMRPNLIVEREARRRVSVDVVARSETNYLVISAKSAGDLTNTYKRRKEEMATATDLCRAYGNDLPFILFLGGHFDCNFLRYSVHNNIDWVWEHRVSDLEQLGL